MQRTETADHSLESVSLKKDKYVGFVFLGPKKVNKKIRKFIIYEIKSKKKNRIFL